MNKIIIKEKGQALVLIALAIVGMIGLIALAIDGGNAFADRRQAQNAADSASLAAAMRYGQDQSVTDTEFSNLILDKTSINGYNNTAPRSTVAWSKTPTFTTDCPAGGAGYFFQVDIDSYNPTWFGRVVGVSEVHNHVTSKSISCAPNHEPAYDGNTIVIMHPTDCKALFITGTTTVKVHSDTNNGVFVNSNGTTTCPALPNNGSMYFQNGTMESPTVSVVGSIYGVDKILPPTVINNPTTPVTKKYIWPQVDEICPAGTADADLVPTFPNVMNPGKFPGSNATWKNKVFPPQSNPPITRLNPGVYCLTNDFKTTNTDVLIGQGVTFVLLGDATTDIPGGTIYLTAPTSGPTKGLLFYVPESNTRNYNTVNTVISIQGGSTSFYSGSIIAPYGYVSIAGSSGTTSIFRTQLIAWTLKLSGGGILDLLYNKPEQYDPMTSSRLELLR
jgi:Flp pilus assembly protein TadG